MLLREDLEELCMVMRIVSFEGRPFAYAQDYAVHVWPQPYFARLPPGSRAIDSFIGEPDMIGGGHGSTYLKLLAERLRTEGSWPSIRTWTTSAPVGPMRRQAFAATPSSRAAGACDPNDIRRLTCKSLHANELTPPGS
jgi:hypothetical protein